MLYEKTKMCLQKLVFILSYEKVRHLVSVNHQEFSYNQEGHLNILDTFYPDECKNLHTISHPVPVYSKLDKALSSLVWPRVCDCFEHEVDSGDLK